MPGVLLSILVAALASLGPAHPDSLSRSRLVVSGMEGRLTVRFQEISLLEIFPELDLDGDGELLPAEIDAGRAPIGTYLTRHWRVYLGAGDEEGEERIEGRLVALASGSRTDELSYRDGAGDGFGWLEAEIEFTAEDPFEVFTIESTLFAEENELHRDVVSLTFNGEEEFYLPFQGGAFRWTFEPSHVRRPGVLASFFKLGFEHIRGGSDHLAFLIVLLVAAPRLLGIVGVVTAFTVAHSITLALMVLDPGGLLDRMPERLVELAIALSIAYVAVDNLLRREARTAWFEAFGFGLLHGLGFAGFLGGALAAEPLKVTALLGFNLGVEAGQLVVVVAIGCLLVMLRRWRPGSQSGAAEELAPRWLRNGVSCVVAVLGFAWFLQRAGWVQLPAWWL